MATKLSNITGNYHSYVADQVLTHFQLNETIDYFDDQNRLNRIFLTGTGIVCGFQVSANPGYTTVTITQGTGITTDGDLIKLKNESSTPELAEEIKQKLFSIDFSKTEYKSFRLFDNDKANYPPFKDTNNEIVPMWELLTKETSLDSNEFLLTNFVNLKDHVVVLYLENYTKDASLCDEIGCANKGGEENFNLRVLVVSQANANLIIGKNGFPERDSLYNKYDIFQEYSLLDELGVKKVIPTFNSTSTPNQIKQLFYAVVNDPSFRIDLSENITTILSAFGYTTQLTAINTRINDLFTINQANIPTDIHYRYDLLKDIVATYKELKDLFIQIKSECNPPIGSFPKHLFLGIVEDNNRFKNYRHQFYKAPILDQNKTFSNFDSLVRRLKSILDNFQVKSNTIKITPSKTTGKLGAKSVPYYYNVDDNLLHAWDFEKSSLYIHQTNFSYHTANLANNNYIKAPLGYCTDDCDFYRIEGYLNNNADSVKTFLETKRKEHGLDFDFYILDIVENAADLKILFNTNYSFEHKAGVKKGGTLLLLKSGETFITDFAIDGKINPESGLGCCTIIQCTYPWISSLKYINNLSRSLNGTPSKTTAMPTHYVLNVRTYSINGVKIITNPVIIRIPLKTIFLRRLHVVMETLNTEFPTGLLFDFIEEEKKVKIMKLDKDKFEFEIQDITQNLKSPVYKFTETGITRNGKIYLTKGISCSIINAHNQDAYRKIHSSYDPINKDDDYGAFNEDWRKWEVLRNKLRKHPLISMYKRYIRTLNDFENIPANQQGTNVLSVLHSIKRDIINADPRLGINTKTQTTTFYIGGDWTNGNWVNSTMAKHYLENMNKSNDEIVQFMKLRQKLHNEVKTSKFIIHIESTLNINLNLLIGVFNQYNAQAEFYLQKPTAAADTDNFIVIT
ncbi:hypothetical protein GON26_09705 [Flavobacterium sp. GA093]|uniref:Uncharacterized protein n=1 Tax=Flavobacterium hydrocarbonoxydans TaxID=2683249 RepID=A0A6I4NJQ9_9FLAO|nr:hypothetical protein [Flavobacterium hydrocarbonoxydans]MWB94638.1 hypothetical protein [Flavobacterium hydrocarbonoxydans]